MRWPWTSPPKPVEPMKLAAPKCFDCTYHNPAFNGDPNIAVCDNPNRVSMLCSYCRTPAPDRDPLGKETVHQRCGPGGVLFKPKPSPAGEGIPRLPTQDSKAAALAQLRGAPDLTPPVAPTPPDVGTSQIVITLEDPMHTRAVVCALEAMQSRLAAQSTMATTVTLGVMIHDQSKPPALWNAFSIGYNVHIKEVRTEPDNLPRLPLHSRAMSS